MHPGAKIDINKGHVVSGGALLYNNTQQRPVMQHQDGFLAAFGSWRPAAESANGSTHVSS